MVGFDELQELLFEFGNFACSHFIKESSDTGIDDTGLFFSRHRHLKTSLNFHHLHIAFASKVQSIELLC
jgi:uncharacterized protein YutD